jgi:pimeloyl-ACP methyl ester carboxylesterase
MAAVEMTTALEPAIKADLGSLDNGAAGTLRYYRDRSAGGRPLLLLHSINAAPSAMEMKPLFEHYRHQRPVYAPDLPGFGLSSRNKLHYTPELYARSISRLIDEVTGPDADIIALSLSAEFAARAIATAMISCRSLTVISPTGLGDREPPAVKTSERVRKVLATPFFGEGLYRLLTSRRSIRYFLDKAFEGSAPAEMIDYAYATSHQPGAHYAPFAFLSTGLFSNNVRTSLYEPLNVPALVLYDSDPNVTFTRLPALLEANACWRAARISPTRGLPQWEKPEETFAALDRFWLDLETRDP